jgi:glycosyltransferase involved in cell wall biosynthesis
MAMAGRAIDPVAKLLRAKPEAFALNNVWAVTGRAFVRRAIERERPDVVVATIPPPSALFATVAVTHEPPLLADVRDLWAGNPYYDRGSRVLARLQGRALGRAAAVVTVTEGCRETLLGLHPELAHRLHVLPNGFDPVLLDRRAPKPRPGDPATLTYAGALYGGRTAEPLVDALASPRLRGRVRLELVGVVDPRTRRAIARASDAAVTVEPPVGWEGAIARVLDADVAVVITTPSTGGDMALPTKLFEALALGRPVLALASPGSDTARLLQRLGQDDGLAEPDDPAGIVAAIVRLFENPPPAVPREALANYDRDRIATRYAALLDELATRSRSATSSGTTTS